MEAWNVSKVEYIDGTQEFTIALDRPFFPSKRETRLDEQIESGAVDVTPFGLARKTHDFEASREKSKKDSVRRALKVVECVGRCNKWDWFVTLTFADDDVGCSYDKASEVLVKWTDALKKRYPDAQWLLVLEMGGKNKRWHAHALLKCEKLRVVDSGHRTRGKTHDVIYNVPLEWSHGFTSVTRVRSSAKCGMYISKYIGKSLGDVPFGKKRYWASRGLNSLDDVRVTYLLDFENLESYVSSLRSCADRIKTVFCENAGRTLLYVTIRGAFDEERECRIPCSSD